MVNIVTANGVSVSPPTSSVPLPGFKATSTQTGGYMGPITHVDWVSKAADIMAGNIMKNWQAAGGKPEGWDESKYGSWAAIVQRNAGKEEFAAFDYKTLANWLSHDYQPRSGDWFNINVGQYVPPSPADWMMPVEDWITLQQIQMKTDEAELERQMRLHQMQVELMQASRASGGSSGGIRYTSGGGGGGSVATDAMTEYERAKLELDWFIAKNQAELNTEELSLRRLQMELDDAYRKEDLRLREQTLEYQRQDAMNKLMTERGLAAVSTMANPNDALQREFMLRQFNNLQPGQEPKGTAVDVFSGQALNNGQPTTWSEIQQTNAQNWGTTAITPGIPPITAPSPPTTEQPPAFATGTKRRKRKGGAFSSYADGTEYGYTREKFFITGDSEDGRPTGHEELIINHDGGRVTVIPNKHINAALSAIANRKVRYAT